MNHDVLRQLPLFSGLSDSDLDRFYQMAELVDLAPGEILIEEGSTGDAVYVVLEGDLEVSRRSGNQDVLLGVRGTGEVLGEMAFVSNAPRNATVRARTHSRLLLLRDTVFEQVLTTSPSAALTIVKTVAVRLRDTESMLVQHQKMASLGTLAAGLAHELNNPAAALNRSASQLEESFATWQRLSTELGRLQFDETQMELLDDLRRRMADRASELPLLDPLARGDREEQMSTWLSRHGVSDVWGLASPLVSAGWDTDQLDELAGAFTAAQVPTVVWWLGAGSAVYELLRDLGESAVDISSIVNAVKMYSHLDRAPVQEVDVHDGLKHTLIILRHELRNVRVVQEYAEDLPRIEAYAGELNQVWTNIIDNAVDAMEGTGELHIRTYRDGERVVVEIEDSGPGIPEEAQAHLFDPFYTTKPLGQGTGLGLNITYNIIVQKHHGDIRVFSEPGRTCFQIRLPLRLE